ncbi:MAG: ABC transporter ATP-binding protein [Ferruginibacter sp.]
MHIQLLNTGKRYNREWIFRHCDYTFEAGKKYAITGSNGSGKSTLLQVICGATTISEGSVQYSMNNNSIAEENAFKYLAVAAPYLDLIEEMTATELLNFHASFKPVNLPTNAILEAVELSNAAHKQIRYFSSGMKQRLKLAQAFFSEAPVLFLDEPTTNLDANGAALYQRLLAENTTGKLVIICSNDPLEYQSAHAILNIGDYK